MRRPSCTAAYTRSRSWLAYAGVSVRVGCLSTSLSSTFLLPWQQAGPLDRLPRQPLIQRLGKPQALTRSESAVMLW
jgi:hypothetical protein